MLPPMAIPHLPDHDAEPVFLIVHRALSRAALAQPTEVEREQAGRRLHRAHPTLVAAAHRRVQQLVAHVLQHRRGVEPRGEGKEGREPLLCRRPQAMDVCA